MVSKRIVRKNYVNSTSLTYEIIISKGKGKLTKSAETMLINISKNLIKKFDYYNIDDSYDCQLSGLLSMFENWKRFDEDKYSDAFPYFTEICKRGIVRHFGLIKNNTKNSTFKYMMSIDSLRI